MKAELIKQLHKLGVYRDPKTKQKLESLKVTQVLEVLNWVNEEMEKGVEFKKQECEYEFVKPQVKKDKLANKKGRR
jgi:hypothetical protein